jgi:hypothetical protein
MKKLLVMSALLLSSMLVTAQTAKVLRVKSYKDGKIIGTKTYNIIQPINVTQTKLVPKTRTITKTKVVKVPQIEYKLVEVPTKATALDTTAILQQYYPKNVHKETITLEDGVGTIQITDTISHNRLVSRKWLADVKPKVKEKVVEIYRPKTVQWYIGPNFTSNVKQPFLSFGASVLRKSLSDNLLQISVGTTVHEGVASPTPYFGFGGYFKIK